MADIFDKFNNMVDLNTLTNEVKSVASKNSETKYKEVPHGKYVVSVTHAEMKESKAGNPMVVLWFKVIEGEYKNGLIFFNQVITKPFQIHIVNSLLGSMIDGLDIGFTDYRQYNDLILDVFEKSGNFEFLLDYSEGKGGFSRYAIEEVYDAGTPF